MMKSKVISGERQIASIFKQSDAKSTITHEWNIGPTRTWIVKPFEGNLSSVVVHTKNIECVEENIVKMQDEDKLIFYTTKNSRVYCKSQTNKKIKVD